MENAERPIAQIIEHGSELGSSFKWSYQVNRVFDKLRMCRTQYLGEQIHVCENPACDHSHSEYASCKSSYCESCNNLIRQKWLEKQFNDIIPDTEYYFVTFKIPYELGWIFHNNQENAQPLIFKSLDEAIVEAVRNQFGDVKIGNVQFLHTWNQQLNLDYHVHVLIPCGFIKEDQWVSLENRGFPLEEARLGFRKKIIKRLIRLYKNNEIISECNSVNSFRAKLNNPKSSAWKMHVSKAEDRESLEKIKSYLAKTLYTLPITSSRIKSLDLKKKEVTFYYRKKDGDYKSGTMTLKFGEFLKRLAYHIQPKYFRRVRQFGFLACNVKTKYLKMIFEQVGGVYDEEKNKEIQSMKALDFVEKYTDWEIAKCPDCGSRLIPEKEYYLKFDIPPPVSQESLQFMAA